MFAVPGWAVSADNLKSETAVVPKATPDESTDSKKRKRPSGPNVTSSNVADLWERVIEGRSGKKAKSDKDHGGEGGPTERPRKLTLKEKKKLKKLKLQEEAQKAVGNSESVETSNDAITGREVKEKKKKKSKDRKENEATVQATQASAPPEAPKLTPMQAAMREKLVSARFRHLNETLYTKPSEESFKLFQDSPEMFQEYHEGFRRQVEVWPENPVDGYIKDIQLRGSQKPPHRSRHGPSAPPPQSSSNVAPLPRTNGTCTIADLGCGDAKLAAALQSSAKKLRLTLLSYDLQSTSSPLVTKADVANLPLPDGAVDVVVFCLALMGTNWLDFVEEAYRVLRWKGELWVAEIKSRFGQVGGGAKGKKKAAGAPVEHSVGNRRKVNGKKPKGRDAEGADGEEDEAELAIEVDGADDKRDETDVSAFVEALRKRGFVLQGAVDLKNKMFVKMHFIKAASPTVGKGVATLKEPSRGVGPKKNGVKFIDMKEDQAKPEESSILKPCVYKLR
ncbi:methyltransferase-domain-containing protein [Annulohypoxylon truncatum]|uniref:methyltransferase-domain-containing protein n=1 Tax=Annulohypoxylon truncatum TaxID=327061 RepID=UPI002008315E|nr:methyltransferase-domain-containing protein [Annulohypoxylon truncatum]KAI1205744.1 methyltransferase-domain-containing protein [Annulohypoxylon truncatum]